MISLHLISVKKQNKTKSRHTKILHLNTSFLCSCLLISLTSNQLHLKSTLTIYSHDLDFAENSSLSKVLSSNSVFLITLYTLLGPLVSNLPCNLLYHPLLPSLLFLFNLETSLSLCHSLTSNVSTCCPFFSPSFGQTLALD